MAASAAPPSGAALIPSVLPISSIPSTIDRVGHRRAPCRRSRGSRGGSGNRRSPAARAGRRRSSRRAPTAAPSPSPCSNARTIGAQPSACTDTIRGRRPAASSRSFELVERLPHADHAGAAAGRIDDPVRPLPVHLLGELVGHRLLAFDAIRLFQRRHVVPAERPAALGRHAAGVGDQSVDERDIGAVQRGIRRSNGGFASLGRKTLRLQAGAAA